MWERRSYTLILKCSERKNWFYITIIILACHCRAVCYAHLLLVQLIWLIYNIVSFWVIDGLTKFSCPTTMPFLTVYTVFCLHISLSTCLRETSFRGSISVPLFLHVQAHPWCTWLGSYDPWPLTSELPGIYVASPPNYNFLRLFRTFIDLPRSMFRLFLWWVLQWDLNIRHPKYRFT